MSAEPNAMALTNVDGGREQRDMGQAEKLARRSKSPCTRLHSDSLLLHLCGALQSPRLPVPLVSCPCFPRQGDSLYIFARLHRSHVLCNYPPIKLGDLPSRRARWTARRATDRWPAPLCCNSLRLSRKLLKVLCLMPPFGLLGQPAIKPRRPPFSTALPFTPFLYLTY